MGVYLPKPKTIKESEFGSACLGGSPICLDYGVTAMQGWRQYMEDAHLVIPEMVVEGFPSAVALFAVFDGHGGPAVSAWVAEAFGGALQEELVLARQEIKAKKLQPKIEGLDDLVVSACEAFQRTFLKLDETMKTDLNRHRLRILHDDAEKKKKEGQDECEADSNSNNQPESLLEAIFTGMSGKKPLVRMIEKDGQKFFQLLTQEEEDEEEEDDEEDDNNNNINNNNNETSQQIEDLDEETNISNSRNEDTVSPGTGPIASDTGTASPGTGAGRAKDSDVDDDGDERMKQQQPDYDDYDASLLVPTNQDASSSSYTASSDSQQQGKGRDEPEQQQQQQQQQAELISNSSSSQQNNGKPPVESTGEAAAESMTKVTTVATTATTTTTVATAATTAITIAATITTATTAATAATAATTATTAATAATEATAATAAAVAAVATGTAIKATVKTGEKEAAPAKAVTSEIVKNGAVAKAVVAAVEATAAEAAATAAEAAAAEATAAAATAAAATAAAAESSGLSSLAAAVETPVETAAAAAAAAAVETPVEPAASKSGPVNATEATKEVPIGSAAIAAAEARMAASIDSSRDSNSYKSSSSDDGEDAVAAARRSSERLSLVRNAQGIAESKERFEAVDAKNDEDLHDVKDDRSDVKDEKSEDIEKKGLAPTPTAAATAADQPQHDELNSFAQQRNDDGADDNRESCLHENDDYSDFEGKQMLPHQPEYCGTTAIVTMVLMSGDTPVLVTANAGDSRAVLARGGVAIPLSKDHKPGLRGETERIMRAGGKVINGRVDGNLNLSRSVGDLCYKRDPCLSPRSQKITAFPDVRVTPLTERDEFVIIACDGIWDCLSNQKAVDTVAEKISALTTVQNQGKLSPIQLSQICEDICDASISKHPLESEGGVGCDNMTLMIVQLNFPSVPQVEDAAKQSPATAAAAAATATAATAAATPSSADSLFPYSASVFYGDEPDLSEMGF